MTFSPLARSRIDARRKAGSIKGGKKALTAYWNRVRWLGFYRQKLKAENVK